MNHTSRIGKLIVYLGLGLAYLKTSEALVPYAPRAVFGWQSEWVGYLWAYLCGALVEGVLYVAYTKLLDRGKDNPTMWLAGLIAGISVVFSITMNRIDQMVTDGVDLTLATGSPLALLHNVVFLIPLFAAVLFMLLEIVDRRVDDKPQRGSGDSRDSRGGGHIQIRTEPQTPRHQPVAHWKGDSPNLAAGPSRPALPAGMREVGVADGLDDEMPTTMAGLAGRHQDNGRSKFTSEVTGKQHLTLAEMKFGQ